MSLTSREKEVLLWIKKGKPSSQISSIMGISLNTVNFHIKNIFNKLGADNRAQAVAMAYERELQQRDLAIRELNHRVMNNFMLLSSMLSLKSNTLKSREAEEIVRDLSLRIKGFASFHKAMLEASDNPCVSTCQFIGRAIDDFSRTIGKAEDKIRIDYEIEDMDIQADNAITCMQIIIELVSNSIKHAFQEGENGRISVRILRVEGDNEDNSKKVSVEVEDNGRGLPDGFDIISDKSRGMGIVSALATRIGSDLKVDPERRSRLSFSFLDRNHG